jgi:hypothetical protein
MAPAVAAAGIRQGQFFIKSSIIIIDFFEKLKTGVKTVPFPKNNLQRLTPNQTLLL